MLILMILGALAEAASIGMVFPLIQVALDPGEANSNAIVQFIVLNIGLPQQGSASVMFAGIFVFFILKNGYLLFLVHCQGGFIWETLSALWARLYDCYLEQPHSFHTRRNSSDLVNNVTVTLRNMFYSFVMPVINITTELCIVAAVSVLLIWAAPVVTLVSMAVLVLLVVVYHLVFKRALARWGANQIDQQKGMILWLNQGMGGIKEVKILGQESYFKENFANKSQKVAQYSRNNLFVTQMPRYIAETIIVSSLLVVIYYVGIIQNSVHEALPLLAMFSMAAFRLMPAVSRITSYLGHISFGGPALDTIYNDLVNLAPEARSVEKAETQPPLPFREALTIDHLKFRYEGATEDTLKDISMEIQRGQSIAFVGPSGAGKTTLADLILGLYKPTEGTIKADGVDIHEVPSRWRRVVGCIPQKVFMLDAPIWANIALGSRAEQVDAATMSKILDQCQLTELIASLPDGIETMVGEGGARFSGGQAQRIGIARSLYADADMLIMDEATSALDSETEHAISRVVDRMKGKKTLIIIAHRLSTVRHCDCLYYMKDGRIIDSGTFEDLHEKNDEFREMVRKMDVSVN